jgi:hypothetical protein
MRQGVLKRLKQKLLADITAPCLAEVLKCYMKKEKGGYAVDCEKLIPGTLDKTGEILKAVSLNPVWVGKAGQGLYCPPEAGQIVVVTFIGFDTAYPAITGFWTDQYQPADGKEGAFILTDGQGGIFELNASMFSLLNNTQSLKSILESLIDKTAAITTTGTAAAQVVSPASQLDLQAIKTNIAQLFKR